MFEQSFVTAPRRPWPKVLSFFLEAVFVGLLVLAPLLFTQAIPFFHPVPAMITAPRHTAVQVVSTERPATVRPVTQFDRDTLIYVTPPEHAIHVIDPPNTPSGGAPNGPDMPGAIPSAEARPVPFIQPPSAPLPAPPSLPRPVISVLELGTLVHRVQPVYPIPAKLARIEGSVMLEAIIGRDGTVQHLRVLSGHPMLTNAAVAAVQQWRYRPYILNGQAVEVETNVTVNFVLQH